MRRAVHLVFAGSVVLLTLVNVAFSSNKTQNHSPELRRDSASFGYWMAAPSNFHASFDPSSPDNWLGGTGNWSNGADWSAGEPGSSSDVFIGTGNDNVTLDTNASINSLTLGGSSGSSMLAGNFAITIAGSLTVNQTGTLAASVTANGNSSNAGVINLTQAGLEVNATFTNSGTINENVGGVGANTLNNSGNINGIGSNADSVSAATLNNSGNINTYSLSATNITNQASGVITAQDLNVSGSLINQGGVQGLMPGSQVTVGGELTNSGSFDLSYGVGTVGSLNNSGGINVGINFTVNGNATNSGNISVGTFDFGQFPLFSVRGTLTNEQNGSIDVDGVGAGATAGAQNLVNSGTVTLETAASFQVSQNVMNSGTIATDNFRGNGSGPNTIDVGGTLTNTATGALSLGGMSDVANISFINNAGSVSVAEGATLNVTGGSHAPSNAIPGFLNTGMVDVAQGGKLVDVLTYTQVSGQTTVDGTLQVTSRGIANFAGGSVYGDGTIEANTISNSNFNIGDMPMTVGLMAIMGNYTQGANGSLTFDIASLSSYDQLNVSGRASLNGTAMINLLNGYIPQVGNMFDIMNFASSSGTFSNVIGLPINGQEHFILEYNSTNLTLDVVAGPDNQVTSGHGSSYNEPYVSEVTEGLNYGTQLSSGAPAPTPEPGTIIMFGSGVFALGAVARRKKLTKSPE